MDVRRHPHRLFCHDRGHGTAEQTDHEEPALLRNDVGGSCSLDELNGMCLNGSCLDYAPIEDNVNMNNFSIDSYSYLDEPQQSNPSMPKSEQGSEKRQAFDNDYERMLTLEMWKLIVYANVYYNFNIDHETVTIQLGKYTEQEKSFYKPHQDDSQLFKNAGRKISMTTILRVFEVKRILQQSWMMQVSITTLMLRLLVLKDKCLSSHQKQLKFSLAG